MEKTMTLFSSFKEAKEGSPPGSEFRGQKGPFLLEPQGRLPGGGGRFECIERRAGPCGQRDQGEQRHGGTQVWGEYSEP